MAFEGKINPDADEIQSTFRRLGPGQHPALLNLTKDEMYDKGKVMAPGGLLLAEIMVDNLELSPGQTVLDLGCGRGQTSIFLASKFGVRVVAVDLWISNQERDLKAQKHNVGHLITNLFGDIKRGLPNGFDDFDAIFCMQSFHTFGSSPGLLNYLSSLLKNNGQVCIGQTCFDREVYKLPDVFNETDDWSTDYDKYHSPHWWRKYFETNEKFEIELCEEILSGRIMWEDHVLYCGDRANWSCEFLKKSAWLIRQIIWSKTNFPALTHFILSGRKSWR